MRKISDLLPHSASFIFLPLLYSITAALLISSTSTLGLLLLITCGVVLLSLALITTHGPLLAAGWKLGISGRSPPLPPGSMGLPYWGESLDYMQSWSKNPNNPDIWYDVRKAKYGNIFKTHILGSPTIVMLGLDANKFVLTNENKLFENSWPISLRKLEGSNAVSMVQGATHKRLRRALHTFLSTEALKRFMGRIEEVIMRQFAQDWPSSSTVNFYAFPALRKLAFQLNAEMFMGLKPGPELEKLRHHYEDFTEGLESQPLDFPWTAFGKARKARAVLLKYIYNEINRRRQELAEAGAECEPKDLLDLLLTSKDEETGKHYAIEEIADNLLLMVHAGQDTTASALAVTIKYLSLDKIILAQLKGECRKLARSTDPGGYVHWEQLKSVELLRRVILEGMRMCAPVSGSFKRAKCDVVFQGYTIPKGWKVHLALRHTHHKSEFFPRPEEFDPSRFEKRKGTYAYIPFGQGMRICPGMNFAKLTMEFILYHFLVNYEWELEDPSEKIMVRTFSPYMEKGLPIIISHLKKGQEITI